MVFKMRINVLESVICCFITVRFKAFREKNPEIPASKDITIEYLLGADSFTCTVYVDGKEACVVNFAYMGDMDNTIGNEVMTYYL